MGTCAMRCRTGMLKSCWWSVASRLTTSRSSVGCSASPHCCSTQDGEHDRQVRLDRVFGAVVDRAGGQVRLGHSEALLDLGQPLVGADDLLGGGIGDIRDVAFDPGQRAGLGLQFAIDGLGGAGEFDIRT